MANAEGSYGASEKTSANCATIGRAVAVKGEISGKEDILIEGSVEGSINLKENSVTVAKGGMVKANVYGLVVYVEGEVHGDIFGSQRVVVRQSGRVRGNINSPKVSIEEGSRVRGTLNTDTDGQNEEIEVRPPIPAQLAKKPSFANGQEAVR